MGLISTKYFQTIEMGDNDSSDQIKKNVGKIILQVNNDILELQSERIADTAATDLKQNIESCQQVLVKSLHSLKEKPGFITNYQLGKLASLIETNIETIQAVLKDGGVKEVNKADIEKSKEEASKTIREGDTAKEVLDNEIPLLIAKIVENMVCHSPFFVNFLFIHCFICSSGVLGCQGYVCFCSSICIKVPSKPIFIFILMAGVRTIIKGEKGQYLGSWATNHKTKDTLLS